MRIDSEVLAGLSGIVIYPGSIVKWAAPHDLEPIDEGDRRRIVENVRAAFAFRGFNIEEA